MTQVQIHISWQENYVSFAYHWENVMLAILI